MTEITASGDVAAREPIISLVVAVDAGAGLPPLLESLAAQSGPMRDCELIVVEPSPIVRDWIERTGVRVKSVDLTGADPATARNAGLERATGTWMSFPMAADAMDSRYLERIRLAIEAAPHDVDLVCARDAANGSPAGASVTDLDASPDAGTLLAARSAFHRRARIDERGVRFDPAAGTAFADAQFTARYLLAAPSARLMVAEGATLTSRRSAGARLRTDRRWAEPETYTTVLERGHLALLHEAAARRGSPPAWVQHLVLADLVRYFRADEDIRGATGQARVEWTDRFHELVAQILGQVETRTIERFRAVRTPAHLRRALVIGYKGDRTRPDEVSVRRVDRQQGICEIRYLHGAPTPAETFRVAGETMVPRYAKTRAIAYLNRVLAHERILWLPATPDLEITLDGRRVPLRPGPLASADPSLGRRVRAILRPPVRRAIRVVRRVLGDPAETAEAPIPMRAAGVFAAIDPGDDARIVRAASSSPVRRRYAGAWTFMDRDTEAHDNAEHLYRFVQRHHPEINSWFVLRRESSDWERLAAEGFRLVPFGTAEHAQLLLNTDHLVSSQADRYVVRPFDGGRFGPGSWRFTFLQHGITYNDLSRWLNGVPIDRFVTASPAEHEAIVGDGTPYVFTEREVRLTGFPRHDRLLELKRSAQRADLILVMPTWRRWLFGTAGAGNTRELLAPLSETAFGTAWYDLVSSEALRSLAVASGLEVTLTPHPNIEDALEADRLPAWVGVRGYRTSDVQELLARAAVTITDYSSQAFEAAYVGCPVVYYQFDRDEFFSGTHAYRKGSWDATTHGFGPVVRDLDAAIDAVREAIGAGEAVEPYRTRMEETFAHRDGGCCERVVASIYALTRPAA